MRYFGGGIGHLWQGVPQRVTYDMDVDSEPEDDSLCRARGMDSFNVQANALEPLVDSPDQAEVDESLSGSDSGSDLDSNANRSDSDDGDCDSDDDDLGPEDGENSDDDNFYSSF